MAEASVLQSVKERGWRRGFANLLRKEHGEWWRTRRWWTQSLIWLLIVNGILALGVWVLPIVEPEQAGDTMQNLGGAMKPSPQISSSMVIIASWYSLSCSMRLSLCYSVALKGRLRPTN